MRVPIRSTVPTPLGTAVQAAPPVTALAAPVAAAVLGQAAGEPTTSVQDSMAYTVIRAGTLIPGRGEPLTDGAVVIAGPTIDWVGPFRDLPARYKSASPHRVPAAMPGLWDVHVHFTGVDVTTLSNPTAGYMPAAPVRGGAVSVADLRATLMAGYTSVRELGGWGGDLAPLVDADVIVGPNVYSSIAAMSVSGGHGDDHSIPYDTVRESQARGGYMAVCDGVDECTKTVRLLVRRGARCIKVCSSGGVLSLLDDPEDRQFSDAELAAIVDEAGRSGRAVAAHAIGKAGIMAALRAGVRSIEHGMYLDEEAADLMIEKGAFFVGTHHVVATLADNPDQLPEPLRKKVLRLRDLADSSYRLAVRKGVKIALGTDTFFSDRSQPLRHGNNARELLWAVRLGLTPLQAIEAATASAAETLGAKAPRSGQLRPGYDADVICLSRDPLAGEEDEERGTGVAVLLGDGKNVTHVWKGGKLYKQPAAGAAADAAALVVCGCACGHAC